MPRLLDVRYLLLLLLNFTGRRLLPFIKILTRYPASVLLNSALCVRLISKIYLFIYISLHTFSSLFGCGHALLFLDHGLANLGLFSCLL
jgi:hypothetical protein